MGDAASERRSRLVIGRAFGRFEGSLELSDEHCGLHRLRPRDTELRDDNVQRYHLNLVSSVRSSSPLVRVRRGNVCTDEHAPVWVDALDHTQSPRAVPADWFDKVADLHAMIIAWTGRAATLHKGKAEDT